MPSAQTRILHIHSRWITYLPMRSSDSTFICVRHTRRAFSLSALAWLISTNPDPDATCRRVSRVSARILRLSRGVENARHHLRGCGASNVGNLLRCKPRNVCDLHALADEPNAAQLPSKVGPRWPSRCRAHPPPISVYGAPASACSRRWTATVVPQTGRRRERGGTVEQPAGLARPESSSNSRKPAL